MDLLFLKDVVIDLILLPIYRNIGLFIDIYMWGSVFIDINIYGTTSL